MSNKIRVHPIPQPIQDVIDKLYPEQDSVLFTMYRRSSPNDNTEVEIPITYVKNRHTRSLFFQIKNYTDDKLAVEVEKELLRYHMEWQRIDRVEALGGMGDWYDENGVLRPGTDVGTIPNNEIRIV